MRQRLFVTGGSGFVGTAVIRTALDQDFDVTALVNRRPLQIADARVSVVRGDLFDDLTGKLDGCAAVIHLVGIIRERPSTGATFDRIHRQGTRAVVDAAVRANVDRFIHMSALGARPDAAAAYHRSKFAAEQIVRNAGPDWTIFQPSLIHGPGGEFTRMQIGWATGKAVPYLFMPCFGTGPLGRTASHIQPVLVDEVAKAMVQSVGQPEAAGQVFPVGGATTLTWPQMHHLAAKILTGHDQRVLAIPAWYVRLLTRLLPAGLLPFSRDQVLMSEQDNVCDLGKFEHFFGWKPAEYAASLKTYAANAAG